MVLCSFDTSSSSLPVLHPHEFYLPLDQRYRSSMRALSSVSIGSIRRIRAEIFELGEMLARRMGTFVAWTRKPADCTHLRTLGILEQILGINGEIDLRFS